VLTKHTSFLLPVLQAADDEHKMSPAAAAVAADLIQACSVLQEKLTSVDSLLRNSTARMLGELRFAGLLQVLLIHRERMSCKGMN